MITGGDLRQSRLDVGYKTFTISPWGRQPLQFTLFMETVFNHRGVDILFIHFNWR